MQSVHYWPILVFLVVGIAFSANLLSLGRLFGASKPDQAKCSTYECGFEPFGDARMPFDVRFYLVALLFVVFDVETAFLFPWAVSLRSIGTSGFLAMMLFLSILVIGFIYEWRRGALNWQ